jgi:hypothetical protein
MEEIPFLGWYSGDPVGGVLYGIVETEETAKKEYQ